MAMQGTWLLDGVTSPWPMGNTIEEVEAESRPKMVKSAAEKTGTLEGAGTMESST